MKTSAQLRQSYLDFFARNGHTVKPSFPIVPQGDATLMFNSAGMVPFKPYFLGLKTDLSRATTSQKCFRTTDIERVGTTLRHLTFFEMLGNFSFGDYFKAEAIAWAWEYLTKDVGLDPQRLYPTVFEEDNEAIDLWKKVGCPNPAKKLGADTNFWNMGPTGPCGPCSEIYYDLGSSFGTAPEDVVGGDGDRYIEIWNLVFTGFDRQPDGSLKKLARPCIDTGMGLERLAFAAMIDHRSKAKDLPTNLGKGSPFETDLFLPIINKASVILKQNMNQENARGFRVIADHSRAATMLIAEGIVPSNVERGYVLRRLVRRAARYGQLMGYPKPFLHELVPAVIGIFEPGYPELRKLQSQIQTVMKTEETKFLDTLTAGEVELNKLFSKSGDVLPGDQVFRLYETFGFPLELTQEIAAQRGTRIDVTGFNTAKEKAAEIARASWKGKNINAGLVKDLHTEFLGYEKTESPATIMAIQEDEGKYIIVLDRTPFYAEGGGQVGDTGELLDERGTKVLVEVIDTVKQQGVHIHLGTIASDINFDSLLGAKVIARVHAERRARIKPHHTATHLMNEALKRVLGPHVRQAGSYVGPDKLRFDFTHPKALTPDEIARIEKIVNDEIKAAHPVIPKCHPVSKVQEFGATTLLGEDYGAEPRFLLIGPSGWDDPKDRFSLELCGGTHVDNTNEILGFKITKESSASAGVRRIEALTGKKLEEHLAEQAAARTQALAQLEERQIELIESIEALGGKAEPAASRAEAELKASIRALESRLGALKASKLAAQAEAGKKVVDVKGLKVSLQRLDGADPKSLRGIADKVKAELGSGLVFIAAPGGGKISFVLAATPDLAAKGVDAAKIAKAFAAAHGGSAGGRADFAQGGAADEDWDKTVAGLTAVIG